MVHAGKRGQMISCPQCQTVLPDSAKFCSSCGRSLADGGEPAPQPGPMPAQEQVPPHLGGPRPGPAESSDETLVAPYWPNEAVAPDPPAWVPGAAQAPQPGSPTSQAGTGFPPMGMPPVPPSGPSAQSGTATQSGPGWGSSASWPQGPPEPPQWQAPPAEGARAPIDPAKLWSRYGGDWSRAAVSLLLLLLSLGLIWNNRGSTVDNVWPVIAVLVALPVSLVDVVLQPTVIGRSYPSGQRLLMRLALVTPLCLALGWSTLDLLINDAGFGPGPMVALAGAAVGITGAVTQSDPSQARRWSVAAAAVFAIGIIWTLILLIQQLIAVADAGRFASQYYSASSMWLAFFALVLGLSWHVYLAARLGLRALRMHPESITLGWWLAASLGIWFLLLKLFTGVYDGGQWSTGFFALSIPAPVSGLLSVGVVLLTAASIRRAVPMPQGHAWLNAASTGLFIIVTAAVVQAVQVILVISEAQAKGVLVWMVLLLLMGAGGAWFSRAAIARNPSTGRLSVLAFAGLFTAALWLTYLIASSVAVRSFSVSDAVLFIGPAAVAFCLLAPPSVRQLLGPIGVPDSLRGGPYGGAGAAPTGQ